MPADRPGPPPPRPSRDRHAGPGFGGGPRRQFGGGGFAGGPRDAHRDTGPRPFPRPAPPIAPALHTVRVRDGEREAEVTGTPEFIRQTLEELPTLLARLRGESVAPSRPASISLPPPPGAESTDDAADEQAQPRVRRHGAAREERHTGSADDADLDDGGGDDDEPRAAAAGSARPRKSERVRHHAATNGHNSLESRVFRVLERAEHPLSVSAIREQLGGESTGQQIRRILERASDRVVATSERPAAYALR